MIGHLLLSLLSNHDTLSAWRRKETDSASVATPPAAGLASAAAAFRDLGAGDGTCPVWWKKSEDHQLMLVGF